MDLRILSISVIFLSWAFNLILDLPFFFLEMFYSFSADFSIICMSASISSAMMEISVSLKISLLTHSAKIWVSWPW